MFNSKRIEELERRIAALEPKDYVTGKYETVTSTSTAPTLDGLEKRIKKIEEEVMPEFSIYSLLYMNTLFGGNGTEPKRLTLREQVARICSHLKIEFKTEPSKVVIKSTEKKK